MKDQFFFGCQLYLNKGEKEMEYKKQLQMQPQA